MLYILTLSGECRLKQKLNNTTYQLDWYEVWNSDSTKCWWGCGAAGILIHCWWGCYVVQLLWKTVGIFLQNWTYSYPVIQQLCALILTYRVWKLTSSQKPSTWMFVADILVAWKLPRCLSLSEWMNRLSCVQTVDRYWVLKRNELLSHGKALRNSKGMWFKWKRASQVAQW